MNVNDAIDLITWIKPSPSSSSKCSLPSIQGDGESRTGQRNTEDMSSKTERHRL
jgi:hypothetical protein